MNGAVPLDQDFSFLRDQPPALRRGFLERARGGKFLAQFRGSNPADVAKIKEWQDNMAVFLEVMEERDTEATRADVLAQFVDTLLNEDKIDPHLRLLAREYLGAVRDATKFPEPPVSAQDLWRAAGMAKPMPVSPGDGHLLSFFDYAMSRADGTVAAPVPDDENDPELVRVTPPPSTDGGDESESAAELVRPKENLLALLSQRHASTKATLNELARFVLEAKSNSSATKGL